MSNGIDTSTPLDQPKINCLLGQEIAPSFVGRYYSFDIANTGVRTPKARCLTAPEAQLISGNALDIVAVYEWRGGAPAKAGDPPNPDDFGYDRDHKMEKGRRDAIAAYSYARYTICQPQNSAIYFAVDFDAQQGDVHGVITKYFEAVYKFFADRNHYYKVGVYGSGLVGGTLLGAHLVEYVWLAQSAGWAGTNGYTDWNIQQGALVNPNPCGFPYDSDIGDDAKGFGSFRL